jgi:hypothetical protein
MTHFGSKVVGHEAYDKAVREEKGGGNVFGTRVRGAIPELGPTNIAKRNSEFGVAVLDHAHASDAKGNKTDSVSIDDLRNILAENPTFFDSLYEAELARADGARPDALSIFYEVERGIKGQGRQDVMGEITALLGQKGIDAEALANQAKVRRIAMDEAQQRNEENKLLGDADRIKSLKEREENLKIVREGKEGGSSQLIASTTEGQEQSIAEREGLALPGQTETATGKVPAKPDGPIHPESSQPGARQGVPKSDADTKPAKDTTDSTSTEEDEEVDFEQYTKAELTEYLGDDAENVKGTGAGGRVLQADLVKAAKKKEKAAAK